MSDWLEDYYKEQKREFFIELDNGDHGGVFFYKMTFKQEVTRRVFKNIMEEARKEDNRYALLYDEEFRDKHNIEDFEEVCIDFYDMLEEKYVTLRYNKETGEHEVVDEDEDEWDEALEFQTEQEVKENVQTKELVSSSIRRRGGLLRRLLRKS